MSPERWLVPAQLLDQRRGQPGPGGPARRSARREACGVSVSEAKGAVTEQKGVQKRVREVGTQSSPGEQEAQRGGLGSSSCFQAPPPTAGAPHTKAHLYNCCHSADAKHPVPRPRKVLVGPCRQRSIETG